MPGWRDLHPEFQAAVLRSCTEPQRRVLVWKAGGLGYRQIARYLLVDKSSVRDMYVRAVSNVARDLMWTDEQVREELRRVWRDAA